MKDTFYRCFYCNGSGFDLVEKEIYVPNQSFETEEYIDCPSCKSVGYKLKKKPKVIITTR